MNIRKLTIAAAVFASVTVLSLATTANAGESSKQERVNQLRKKFTEGATPTPESLQLRETWYCDEIPAFKGSGPGFEDGVYFRFKRATRKVDNGHYKNSAMPMWLKHRILHVEDSALMGYGTPGLDPIEDTTYMYFIRVSGEGDLLVESAVRKSRQSGDEDRYLPAITKRRDGDNLLARSYLHCKTEFPVSKD